LTSIFLCFLGVQCGRIILFHKEHIERIKRWMIWGVVLGIIAAILCGAKQNGGLIPINKNLWSPSFVICMASFGFIALTVCYILIDVQEWWTGAPFKFVGMNSILIYCSHEILNSYFPFSFYTPNTHLGYLASNLVGVSCWLIIAYRMYQLKFFVNI